MEVPFYLLKKICSGIPLKQAAAHGLVNFTAASVADQKAGRTIEILNGKAKRVVIGGSRRLILRRTMGAHPRYSAGLLCEFANGPGIIYKRLCWGKT